MAKKTEHLLYEIIVFMLILSFIVLVVGTFAFPD